MAIFLALSFCCPETHAKSDTAIDLIRYPIIRPNRNIAAIFRHMFSFFYYAVSRIDGLSKSRAKYPYGLMFKVKRGVSAWKSSCFMRFIRPSWWRTFSTITVFTKITAFCIKWRHRIDNSCISGSLVWISDKPQPAFLAPLFQTLQSYPKCGNLFLGFGVPPQIHA